jgi:hypothetical protein
MIHIEMTRGRQIRSAAPMSKHHKAPCRNGHRNGTVQEAVICTEVPAIWADGYGGEAKFALAAFAIAQGSGKNVRQALDLCLNTLKVLRQGLEVFIEEGNVGGKLAERVAALREIPNVLLRHDASGTLVVSQTEILQNIRLIERLISDLRNAVSAKQLLAVIRQRKSQRADRGKKLSFIRHKRRVREKMRECKRVEDMPVNERSRIAKLLSHCNGTVWTGGPLDGHNGDTNGHTNGHVAEVEDGLDDQDQLALLDLDGWEEMIAGIEARSPWAEYRNGVVAETNGDGNGESETVVATLIVLAPTTACGEACEGCPVAVNCPHATGQTAYEQFVNAVEDGPGGAVDGEELFDERGWKEPLGDGDGD